MATKFICVPGEEYRTQGYGRSNSHFSNLHLLNLTDLKNVPCEQSNYTNSHQDAFKMEMGQTIQLGLVQTTSHSAYNFVSNKGCKFLSHIGLPNIKIIIMSIFSFIKKTTVLETQVLCISQRPNGLSSKFVQV